MKGKLEISPELALPLDVASQAVAILGIRGSGKTNTAGVMAEELLEVNSPVVIIDPTDAWWGIRSGYPVLIFGGSHGDLPLQETDGKQIAEFQVQEQVPFILSLRHLRKGAQRRFVTEFCEELYHLKGKDQYRSPLTVFIDEAPLFVPQKVMGEVARTVGAVEDLIARGRNAGFGVVLISQRSATLNKDVLTQADTIIAHRLTGPQDRKALSEWIEENATIERQKEVLASLAPMRDGQAWVWAPRLNVMKQVQVRLRRTFDSSASPKMGETIKPPKSLKEVDLEKLRGKLAASIEKARQDDPAAMKKRIAELERELKKPAAAAPAAPKENRVEVPVLKDGQISRLESLLERMEKKADVFSEASAVVRTEAGRIRDAIAAFTRTPPPAPSPRPAPRVQPAPSTPRPQPVHRPAPAASGNGTPSDLGKCELSILRVLSQYPGGCEKGKLALLAGYRWSGGFRNSLSMLRTAGLIEGDNSTAMRITPEGEALGPFEPLPTGQAFIDYWLNYPSFGKCEREVLRALIEHPGGLRSDDLCMATGYEWSGGFRNALSTLRTAGVVVGRNNEVMRASEEFFR